MTKPPTVSIPKRVWILKEVAAKPPVYWDRPNAPAHEKATVSEGRVEFMAKDTREPKEGRAQWLNGKPFQCWASWTIPPAQAAPGQTVNMTISGEYAEFASPMLTRLAWPNPPAGTAPAQIGAPAFSHQVPITWPKIGLWIDDDKPGNTWHFDVSFELIDVIYQYRYIYELR